MNNFYLAREILLSIREHKNWVEISKLILKGKKYTKVILRNGMQIEAPIDNPLLQIVHKIYFKNVYNPVYLPINANDIVVDIGANIGVFTLFAASKTTNKVFAFEPFPENFLFLNQNINRNCLKNVIAYETAVSDKIGSDKLFCDESGGGHTMLEKLETYVEVPTTTLQKIIDTNNIKQVDFLKIDCEGAEGLILNSTPLEYLKKVRKISIEFHDNVSSLKHENLSRLLEQSGFNMQLNWDGKSQFGYLYGKRID